MWLQSTVGCLVERFLYYTTVRVSNKIFPSTYMEAVALTVKATQARQHQHSSLRLSCYLLMRAVAYLVKWNWCCSACVTHHNEFVTYLAKWNWCCSACVKHHIEFVTLSVNLPTLLLKSENVVTGQSIVVVSVTADCQNTGHHQQWQQLSSWKEKHWLLIVK